jgi:hypothetical protein
MFAGGVGHWAGLGWRREMKIPMMSASDIVTCYIAGSALRDWPDHPKLASILGYTTTLLHIHA